LYRGQVKATTYERQLIVQKVFIKCIYKFINQHLGSIIYKLQKVLLSKKEIRFTVSDLGTLIIKYLITLI